MSIQMGFLAPVIMNLEFGHSIIYWIQNDFQYSEVLCIALALNCWIGRQVLV